MIVHDVLQGSEEWKQLRIGIPTASEFHRIITAVGWKLSAGAAKYTDVLIAEHMNAGPVEAESSKWMTRGKEMEPEAAKWYAASRGVKLTAPGFITNDDWTIGCSPDRLVGDDGGLEVKNPSLVQHIAYVRNPEALLKAHAPQVVGCLWLCERQWWDVMSFSKIVDPVIVRIERDEEQIAKLASAVETFAEQLEVTRKRVIDGT